MDFAETLTPQQEAMRRRKLAAARRSGRKPRDPSADWAQWKIASGHPKGWRVIRCLDGDGVTMQQHESAIGNVRLYKTPETAQRIADKLNGKVVRDKLSTAQQGIIAAMRTGVRLIRETGGFYLGDRKIAPKTVTELLRKRAIKPGGDGLFGRSQTYLVAE